MATIRLGDLSVEWYMMDPHEISVVKGYNLESRRQAVLGRQVLTTTPWLTERHGYDPT